MKSHVSVDILAIQAKDSVKRFLKPSLVWLKENKPILLESQSGGVKGSTTMPRCFDIQLRTQSEGIPEEEIYNHCCGNPTKMSMDLESETRNHICTNENKSTVEGHVSSTPDGACVSLLSNG